MEMSRKNRGSYSDCPDGPPPSQIENQVQMILQKQMDTNITLNSQFDQHRHFRNAGELCVLPASSAGLHSVRELQTLEEDTKTFSRLVRAGLNDQEIALYLKADKQDLKSKNVAGKKYSCEPQALERRILDLRSLVANSDYQNNFVLSQGDHDTSEKADHNLPQDPFTYIAEFAKKFEPKRKRKRHQKTQEQDGHSKVDKTEEVPMNVDQSVWHAVVPLPEEDIVANRLSPQDIQKIPRFADYEPGQPHSALYLKNVHVKATLQELIAVFSRFEKPEAKVKYRMMSGRMRGQAFIHFSDVETATEALQLVNGYKLRGQPLIVTYAHRKEPKSLGSTM